MNKYISFKNFLVVAIMTSSCAAFAVQSTSITSISGSEAPSGYAGVLLGANIPNSNNKSPAKLNYGLTAGAKITPAIGLGLYGTYFSQGDSFYILEQNYASSMRNFTLASEFNFFLSMFHVGADLGVGVSYWSASMGDLKIDNSETYLIYGPEVGLDVPLAQGVSLGVEAHYIMNNESGIPNNLQALAAIKVWL